MTFWGSLRTWHTAERVHDFLGQLAHLAHWGTRGHDFFSGLGGLGLGPRYQARAHDENPRPRLFGAARAPGTPQNVCTTFWGSSRTWHTAERVHDFLGQLAYLAHWGTRGHDFFSGLGGLGLGPRYQARAHDENPRPRLFGCTTFFFTALECQES
jgi:hypothetical protein